MATEPKMPKRLRATQVRPRGHGPRAGAVDFIAGVMEAGPHPDDEADEQAEDRGLST
jgi:hypothetical protein